MSPSPADPLVPLTELRYRTSRSSGKGGQNVNKVETKVTLLFDLADSPSLSADQKRRVREKLSTRINKSGVLRVSSERHRTQEANRRAATVRFYALLEGALKKRRPRRATAVPRGAREKRRRSKQRRSELKKSRRRHDPGDD